MKKLILLTVIFCLGKSLYAQQVLGKFTVHDQDEWPQVIWYRDIPNNWDEGLIKHSSSRGVFGRAGFGIHLHKSRDWSFFSSHWTPLFSIEGGTGNAYLKGKLGIGHAKPSGLVDIKGGNGSWKNPALNLQSNSENIAWALIRLKGGLFDTAGDYMIGRGKKDFNQGRALTIHVPSRSDYYGGNGSYPQIAFVSSGAITLGHIQAETGNWYMKGNVGIGVTNPKSKLVVDGKIRSEAIVVDIVNGPDYVFDNDYELRTLKETKQYISENKHLPEIPSAKEMEANGIELGDMNMRLLKKIEELTLYQIGLLEKLEKQNSEIHTLKKKVEQLEKN